ncbi:hypothetical protein V8C86DRAFT_2901003 [Haematococcus lacustris]
MMQGKGGAGLVCLALALALTLALGTPGMVLVQAQADMMDDWPVPLFLMLVRSRLGLGFANLTHAIEHANNVATFFPWSHRIHLVGAPSPTVHFSAESLRTVHIKLQETQLHPVPGGTVFDIINGQLPCPA